MLSTSSRPSLAVTVVCIQRAYRTEQNGTARACNANQKHMICILLQHQQHNYERMPSTYSSFYLLLFSLRARTPSLSSPRRVRSGREASVAPFFHFPANFSFSLNVTHADTPHTQPERPAVLVCSPTECDRNEFESVVGVACFVFIPLSSHSHYDVIIIIISSFIPFFSFFFRI